MGIRVECDWCRKPIEAGLPYITIEVDGKIVKGCSSNKLEDVCGPARVYCGADRYYDDDPAACGYWTEANKMYHRPSCAQRVLTALDGNPEGRVDMGLEWRLVAQGAPNWEHLTDGPVELLKLEGRVLAAIKRAGITHIRELGRLTEAQWLAIPGIGRSRGNDIRKALRSHEKVKPKELAKREKELMSA
jgi:hypothetical protein